MAKLKERQAARKEKPVPDQKKRSKKALKVFLAVFGLVFMTVLLYQIVNLLSKAVAEAKTVWVEADGEWGSPGDGAGQFKEPQDVATDASGNFYVSDFSAHRIQKFDPNGTPLMSIGKEGKDEGDFEQPSGFWVDTDGNIFVCDTFNHRIERFDSEGNIVKAWNHGFFGPRGIVGSQGRLYVTDTGNHKIQVFDMDGNFQAEWGKFGTSDGMFREPVGIAADPQGNIYVADSDNRRVQKFDPNGKFLAAFRISTWKGKNDEIPYLCFENGFLYASNSSLGAVLKLDANGKLAAIYKRKNPKEGFSGAAGVAVDSQNHVFVVEKGYGKVARFTPPTLPAK